MKEKINCQLINVLLDKDNQFVNKYTSVISGGCDCDFLLEEYFVNKNMRSIQVDKTNQSICFTNQKDLVSYYDKNNKKTEFYHEEVHIHCNDLYHFDRFVDYLSNSKFSDCIDEVDSVSHYDKISKGNIQNFELVMYPMTNEVSTTRSLVNILSQRSKETVFRALAIYFEELTDNTFDIDIDLIHKLNDIYNQEVIEKKNSLFSNEISNRLLNIHNNDNTYESKVSKINSQNISINNTDYSISYTPNSDSYGL